MFMAPLLMQTAALRTVAVTIEPVPYSLAMRRAEAAQTAEVAEEINRSRQGFVSTAPHPPPPAGRLAARGGAGRRPRRDALGGVRADLGAERGGAGARRVRGRARRPARPPRPAAPLRRAGRRPSPSPCRSAGGCGEARAPRERPGHSGTTAHFQAAYPFLGQGGLGAPGAYIGRDAYGGAWRYDPWALYPRHLSGPEHARRSAASAPRKSTLVKTYLYRQARLRPPGLGARPQGRVLAAGRGARRVSRSRLAPGGEVRLNPLSPRGGREGQLGLLRSVAQAALRRELSPEEDAGLRVALDVVDEESGAAEPTLPMVVDALLHPREAMVAGVSATGAEEFAEANRACALALQRLCEGDLRGMFDGPTTRGPRPRRAAGRPRPVRGARLRRARDPDDLRGRLAAGDPAGAKAAPPRPTGARARS